MTAKKSKQGINVSERTWQTYVKCTTCIVSKSRATVEKGARSREENPIGIVDSVIYLGVDMI